MKKSGVKENNLMGKARVHGRNLLIRELDRQKGEKETENCIILKIQEIIDQKKFLNNKA